MIKKVFILCGKFVDVKNFIFLGESDMKIAEKVYKSSLQPLN